MKQDIFTYGKTPEQVGIKSEWLKSLYKFLIDRQFLSHSFVVIKDHAVLSEGYFAPFKKSDFHRMYSTSKSFVATAIGLLVDEGKVRLDDQVIRFFPEYDNDDLPEYTRLTTVKDLLTMETPFKDVTYSWKRDDWVNSFFTTEPTHPSGTYYHYDTSGTFILNVIVERLTGSPSSIISMQNCSAKPASPRALGVSIPPTDTHGAVPVSNARRSTSPVLVRSISTSETFTASNSSPKRGAGMRSPVT